MMLDKNDYFKFAAVIINIERWPAYLFSGRGGGCDLRAGRIDGGRGQEPVAGCDSGSDLGCPRVGGQDA